MFAIVSIPAGTEDAFSWGVSEFAHLDYLGPVVTAEGRGDFRTNLARDQAVIPAPDADINDYASLLGAALVGIFLTHADLLAYLEENRDEWREPDE